MNSSFWTDVTVWPSLSDVAAMLRLNKATLSRHAQRGHLVSQALGLGRSKRVVPPGEVLRLGELYQRVPRAVLTHELAAFVAARTQADAAVIAHELETAASCTDGEMEMALDKTGVAPRVPEWMLEYEQLSATPVLQLDKAPFIAASLLEDSTYTGPYRENATDVTLHDMGLDPAIFRR